MGYATRPVTATGSWSSVPLGNGGSRCGLCPVTHLREQMGIPPFPEGSSGYISPLALLFCPCVFEHIPRARKMSLRHGHMCSLSSAFWHGEAKAQGIGWAPTASATGGQKRDRAS